MARTPKTAAEKQAIKERIAKQKLEKAEEKQGAEYTSIEETISRTTSLSNNTKESKFDLELSSIFNDLNKNYSQILKQSTNKSNKDIKEFFNNYKLQYQTRIEKLLTIAEKEEIETKEIKSLIKDIEDFDPSSFSISKIFTPHNIQSLHKPARDISIGTTLFILMTRLFDVIKHRGDNLFRNTHLAVELKSPDVDIFTKKNIVMNLWSQKYGYPIDELYDYSTISEEAYLDFMEKLIHKDAVNIPYPKPYLEKLEMELLGGKTLKHYEQKPDEFSIYMLFIIFMFTITYIVMQIINKARGHKTILSSIGVLLGLILTLLGMVVTAILSPETARSYVTLDIMQMIIASLFSTFFIYQSTNYVAEKAKKSSKISNKNNQEQEIEKNIGFFKELLNKLKNMNKN